MGNLNMHMNKEARAQAERLLAELIEAGVSGLTDQRGNPSLSALFRHLVAKEIEVQKLTALFAKEAN